MDSNRIGRTLASLRARLFIFTLLVLPALALMPVTATWARGPITHHVSVGSPDACAFFDLKPGCDANFSLTANVFADGSVRGEYTDRFRYYGPGDGFHAKIDCVSVDGNEAWVSGVITSGTSGGFDLTGLYVATRVRDNGTSANDPPDEISLSWISDVLLSCAEHSEILELYDLHQGQVVIKSR